MKSMFIIVSVLVAVMGLVGAQDVNVMLRNKALVDRQIKCILDLTRCDVIGRQIKAALPEVLHNRCGRCTPVEASNANKVIVFMRTNYPEEWKLIKKKYGKLGTAYN